jgi:putative oxygen-independent coproporphyrinogen III oxidase
VGSGQFIKVLPAANLPPAGKLPTEMAGLYLHIPFCKQACHYCNFHFSTSMRQKDAMLAAILVELERRKDYLGGEPVETIYFGGGTPSLLTNAELDAIIEKIYRLYPVAEAPEITLEANPDDLHLDKIKALRQSPVNRLSIGVQSFSDEDLKFMNRAHSASEALACIENAQDAGFENLTVDLIYGSPTTSDTQWEQNIGTVLEFKIPHISCYCLTVEPKTALAHFIKNGKAQAVDDEQGARQFETLMERLEEAGYEHYEISNFAKPGNYSRHNTSYWQGKKYLGIGPSAHSFDGVSRQWNVANNARYIRAVKEGKLDFEKEELTPEQRYNEYVMTALRTIWGCDLNKVREIQPTYEKYFLENAAPFIVEKALTRKGRFFYLTKRGKLMADHIASELFLAG